MRGRVVKANKNIMGTNWYHIQDGSGEGAHGDLTITTSASLNVGDLVLITGTGTVDKDFGAGYRYEFIIENAVKGMLPRTKLGRQMIKKLNVYAGAEHPHEAQQPQTLDI